MQPELRGNCGCLRLERMVTPGPHQSPPQLCRVVHSYPSASGLTVRVRCKGTDDRTTGKKPTEPLLGPVSHHMSQLHGDLGKHRVHLSTLNVPDTTHSMEEPAIDNDRHDISPKSLCLCQNHAIVIHCVCAVHSLLPVLPPFLQATSVPFRH